MQFKDCVIGMEFGSTRIKSVMADGRGNVLASGSHIWENRFENGIWTYFREDIILGLQACYADLKSDVMQKYGVKLTEVGAIGISAMMHGYLVLDKYDNVLTPFRTWRNNNAAEAAEKLTEIFGYPIPARWSIAHLYQAILNGEKHIKDIAFQTTLAGYVHYLLTGEKVTGIDEASGMFPVNGVLKDFDAERAKLFENLVSVKERAPFSLKRIFPKVLVAGEVAGFLTEEGAKLLDPDGDLKRGIPLCPPEGDVATGMVATNAVKAGAGNVSAGTSIFCMVALDKPLKQVHPEIDMVATPAGAPVAMVHCNNCSSDINAWANVFADFAKRLGSDISRGELFKLLFEASLEGDADCGEIISYNFVSGENIAGIDKGRPLVIRKTESNFTLSNFMRSQIYSSMATLKTGLYILSKEENIEIRSVVAHGGLFKTERVAQQYLANAVGSPVTVMRTAGEGGAWGMALLALYFKYGNGRSLTDYLDENIFSTMSGITVYPDKDAEGMEKFMAQYKNGLAIVRKAAEVL